MLSKQDALNRLALQSWQNPCWLSAHLTKLMYFSQRLSKLDPVPKWLLKTCIDQLLPPIMAILNESKLSQWCSLVWNELPIWNLLIISRLVERVTAGCIEEQLQNNACMSAYCRDHARETALLAVHMVLLKHLIEDLWLHLLCLYATFKVIDHPILLKHLEFSFAIKQKALSVELRTSSQVT